MPKKSPNKQPNSRYFRKQYTVGDRSIIPHQSRRAYKETCFPCQGCGRLLQFNTKRTDRLCQICFRMDRNLQNIQYPPPFSQPPFYTKSDNFADSNDHFDNHNGIMYPESHQILNHENNVPPDSWERKIYISETRNASKNCNQTKNPQELNFKSDNQRIINDKSFYNSPASSSSNHHPYTNHQLSNKSSSQTPIYHTGEFKRKREPEETFSKRNKTSLNGPPSTICAYAQLSINILRYYKENSQTEDNFTTKMSLRSRLQSIIETRFAGCDLYMFGSSMTGFGTRSSDADMSLIFHEMELSKNRVRGMLYELRSLLTRQYHYKKLLVIMAKVPILKFLDLQSGYEVDLNINNPTGIRNSQLLRSYARIDGRLKPLILAAKFWAREHNINDASQGTLSSYSLGLMLINYLQCGCNPPVLPALQVMQPDKFLPNSDVRALRVNEELPYFESKNNQTVGQLFAGFLHYYSKEFDYVGKRISVRLGCLLPRVDKLVDKQKDLRRWIDIEEPFERTNTAGAVQNARNGAFIKSVFDKSFDSVFRNGTMGLI